MKKIFAVIAFLLCLGSMGEMVFSATYTLPYISLNRTPYAKTNKSDAYNYKRFYKRNAYVPRQQWDSRVRIHQYRYSPKFQPSDYEKWRMMSGDSYDLSATEYNQSNGGMTREEARQKALEESAKRKRGQMCGENFSSDEDIERWDCECDLSQEYEDREWECNNKRQEFCAYDDSSLGEYLTYLEVKNRCCTCDDGWKCEYSTVAGSDVAHECSGDVYVQSDN